MLPHVQLFNARAVSARLKDIAEAMGVDVNDMNNSEGARACITAIKNLSVEIGIPENLSVLKVNPADIHLLAENALKDACALTNPVQGSLEDVINIFRSAM